MASLLQSAVAALPAELVVQLRSTALAMFKWGNSDYLAGGVTKGWALTTPEEAFVIVVAYIVLAIIGNVLSLVIPEHKTVVETSKDGKKTKKAVNVPMLDVPVKALQLLYNVVQVALCCYMMAGAVQEYLEADYTPVCNAYNPKASGMASVVHVFYLSKVLDFCDTVFIILRYKWRQLSFLHTFHHASIFTFYWLLINVAYDGDIYLTVVLNSFVHACMYAYYALTSIGLHPPKLVKMAVTRIQMVQFVIMMTQALYLRFYNCPYPANILWAYFFYIAFLLALFSNFSSKTYSSKKKKE